MSNVDLYKLYQVTNVFITKYDYIQFVLKTNQNSSDEAWLTNYENPYYQVIRVSFDNDFSDEKAKIIDTLLEYFKKDANKTDLNFLDIHISNDIYDKEIQKFDYLNINEEYQQGVDLQLIYPELYGCIHKVENPELEISNVLIKAKEKLKAKIKQMPFLQRNPYLFTYSTIIICCALYLITALLASRYDSTSVYLLLGADYKILTLGCHEYYRLITYGFLHSSVIHLFCNMASLLSLGRFVEKRYGHFKFVLILLISILCGSLTQGILTDNGVCVGLSGGLYGLFVVYLMDVFESRIIDIRRFLPLISLNIMLNFISSVAWMCHLGGAIAGLCFYLVFSKKNNFPAMALLAILVFGLLFKYLSINSITNFYGGTDNDYVNLLRELNFDSLNIYKKILKAYTKYGG